MGSAITSKGATDGRIIEVRVEQDNQTNKFAFDYPERKNNPEYFQLLNAVFNLLNKRFSQYEAYIEENQGVFYFNLGVKLRGNSPKHVRLYGYPDSVELHNFLKSLSLTESLIMDVSNLPAFSKDKMQFLAFEKSHPNLIWVVGQPRVYDFLNRYDLKETMKEIGFDTTKMVRDTLTAVKRFDR
jgi:hypothetical protein